MDYNVIKLKNLSLLANTQGLKGINLQVKGIDEENNEVVKDLKNTIKILDDYKDIDVEINTKQRLCRMAKPVEISRRIRLITKIVTM